MPLLLTLTLDEGEWSASRTCSFTPGERAPSTHWVRGCVGSEEVKNLILAVSKLGAFSL
jgi:hypothetical protein